jgi:hypothetical protein
MTLKNIDVQKRASIGPSVNVKTELFGSCVKNEMKLFGRNTQSKNIFTQLSAI